MADRRRAKCKRCRASASDCGPISWSGYCGRCGPEVFVANNDDLHNHAGPYFDHWRRAMAASVGAVLLDELEPEAYTARP